MKITKITLQAFRAFDEPFELDLEGGKNLLLYGENGSGKSSIYMALKRFFELRGDDIVKNHRNKFSKPTRESRVTIHVNGKDGGGADFNKDVVWDSADIHPLKVPADPTKSKYTEHQRSALADAARRAGFLDYRSLLLASQPGIYLPRAMVRDHLEATEPEIRNRQLDLRQHFFGSSPLDLEEQLFDLATLSVLAGVRIAVGGSEASIGELVRSVWEHRPLTRHQRQLRIAGYAANSFSDAFNAKLPEIEKSLAEFLGYFNNRLEIRFQQIALSWKWTKKTVCLEGARLVPLIKLRGTEIADAHRYLNEARLSALAVCLFLTGVRLADNDYNTQGYPRFLVLDDALIGLEHANRLPILEILGGEMFKNYQVFLLTHDRVWFELARGHLSEKANWLHKELLADESSGELVTLQKPSKHDLSVANEHFKHGDLKAAAVYARSAFEGKLRNVCEHNGIKIPFKPDADKIGAGVLWDGIVSRQREREADRTKGAKVPDFVPPDLEKLVETMRSTVLNKLSHTGAAELVAPEVEAAIATVEKVVAHGFPKTKQ